MARKHLVAFFALFHLLGFSLIRSVAPLRGHAGEWCTLAAVVVAFLVLRDFASSRRKSRLPDLFSAAAWGTAVLLELHALSPALAGSRLVPFLLFPVLGFLLAPARAAVLALVSVPWLSGFPERMPRADGMLVSLLAMAALGLLGGFAARRKARSGARDAAAAETAEDKARPLLLSWEDGDAESGDGSDPARSAEQLLRWHDLEAGDAIRRTLEGILPTTGADRVMLVTLSEELGRPFVVRHAAQKGAEEAGPGQTVPDSFVPAREAMIFRRAFCAKGEEAAVWGLAAGGRKERPSGVAAVPVIVEGKAEGAVVAFRFGDGEWSEPVVPLLETAAFFVAREIADGRRRYREDRALAVQAGFHRFVRRIARLAEQQAPDGSGSASPRRELYRATAREVRTSLRSDRVLLVEAEQRKMRGRIVWEEPGAAGETGKEEEFDEAPWAALEGTYAGWVLKQGVHRIFSGVGEASARHPILPESWVRPGEGDYLLAPVAGPDGFRGLLVCASRPGRSYHGRDADEAREFLTIMRLGISHALQIETLERQATTDGLTGLLNQKTFRARLVNVLDRLDGRYPCAVVMLDLDHFKRINDTYGHPAGDEVLRKVSGIIRKTVRKVDIAGRYGGEEFVLYLHLADRERAGRAAERLRLVVERTRFVFAGKEVGVTASLGVACYPGDARTSEELLARADEALYRSKEGGRNRITFHDRQAVS